MYLTGVSDEAVFAALDAVESLKYQSLPFEAGSALRLMVQSAVPQIKRETTTPPSNTNSSGVGAGDTKSTNSSAVDDTDTSTGAGTDAGPTG